MKHLLDRLQAYKAGDVETAYGTPPPPPEPQSTSGSDPSSGMKANRRPVDPDDSAEAGLQLPVAESLAVKIYLLCAMLTLSGYIGLRLWDIIINIHEKVLPASRCLLFGNVSASVIPEHCLGLLATTCTLSDCCGGLEFCLHLIRPSSMATCHRITLCCNVGSSGPM